MYTLRFTSPLSPVQVDIRSVNGIPCVEHGVDEGEVAAERSGEEAYLKCVCVCASVCVCVCVVCVCVKGRMWARGTRGWVVRVGWGCGVVVL